MSVQIFTGDDRVKISAEIQKILGENYELFDGETVKSSDLPSILLGETLFSTGETRKILIKDLGQNPTAFADLLNYLDTDFSVVLWEQKLDKRTATYKNLKAKNIKITELNLIEPPEKKLVFDIFDLAYSKNLEKSLSLLDKIIALNQDPYMFFGLLVSQALKKLEYGDRKAEPALKILSEIDIELKTTGFDPWLLIKKTLVKLSSL
jgi:DNA polymerase III delta subunit